MSISEDIDINEIAAFQLQTINQRYTKMRKSLMSILYETHKPLTIPEILEINPTFAQSSVYRNLSTLEEAGLVIRIVTHDDRARYELAEHILEHHHHIICTPCGEVLDFHLSQRIEEKLEESLQKIADEFGFSVDRHQLDLIGKCGKCSE